MLLKYNRKLRILKNLGEREGLKLGDQYVYVQN